MRRPSILTWHIHGNYLYYLAQADVDLFVPVGRDRPGYGGRTAGFPWPPNVHEIHADDVRRRTFDCVIYQSARTFTEDRYEVLSSDQRDRPSIYLEHDPPLGHPTDSRHPADDPDVLVVHVTHFNQLMWDCGKSPVVVIEHGVAVPDAPRPTYELRCGVTVVNNLARRGRRVGPDVFVCARERVPLHLYGMHSEDLGGQGELSIQELPHRIGRYRFFFNPIRHTSLGLAVCEAMTCGLPVVGLATTELPSVIESGVSGFVDTDVESLVVTMHRLLNEPGLAAELGAGAARTARERFDIGRFAREWELVIADVSGRSTRFRRASAAR